MSPIADLFDLIAASPFSLAPERAADLHQIRLKRSIRIHFDDGVLRNKNFGVDPERGLIRVGLRALERLWAGCLAHWHLARAVESHVKRGTEIDLVGDESLSSALATLEWAHSGETDWPQPLRRPQRPGTNASTAEAEATEFFLGATGWTLLHEVGHVVLEHPISTTSDEAKQQELDADAWATTWVLGRWREYDDKPAVLGKRAVAVALGICDIAYLEAYERRAGGTTHPDPPVRLGRFLQEQLPRYTAGDTDPFAEFARLVGCAALILHLQKNGIPLDSLSYDSVDDLLGSVLFALSRHR